MMLPDDRVRMEVELTPRTRALFEQMILAEGGDPQSPVDCGALMMRLFTLYSTPGEPGYVEWLLAGLPDSVRDAGEPVLNGIMLTRLLRHHQRISL
jgi:hypothetical protein